MASGPGYPIWAVLGAQNEGLSASAGLGAYRDAGGEVRTQSWYRLWGEARAAVADKLDEATAPLNRRPSAHEVQEWTTTNATGFLQQVEVFVRDRITGEVVAKPFSVTGEHLISRGNAISQALDHFSENQEDYDETVLGAVHVGAYQMTPGQ